MRVLVVSDKFKGTLTARQAAEAIARGWRRARAKDQLELLPMSDGGDGFGEVMCELIDAQRRTVWTVDAAHRPCRATWWWESKGRTAVVESAQVIGLSKLPEGQFHPFHLDTAGLGNVLATIAGHRPRRLLVGVGGSATNDGGFGMARSLGWLFLNRQGHEIESWTDLGNCIKVVPSRRRLRLGKLTVAVDVQNKLLGSGGCTRVYGPQKGLSKVDFALAERALRRLATLCRQRNAADCARVPGSGAAGGLGFGLMAFCGAQPASGFDVFARESMLNKRVRSADLVLTGEGALDDQSLMGKGVGELARLCKRVGVPCIALTGVCRLNRQRRGAPAEVYSIVPGVASMKRAMNQPATHLENLAREVAGKWVED